MLALTFDDGPGAHTERILDAFAAHGGKGTFYVVGNMLDGRPDTLRRMAAEGHKIGSENLEPRRLVPRFQVFRKILSGSDRTGYVDHADLLVFIGR